METNKYILLKGLYVWKFKIAVLRYFQCACAFENDIVISRQEDIENINIVNFRYTFNGKYRLDTSIISFFVSFVY